MALFWPTLGAIGVKSGESFQYSRVLFPAKLALFWPSLGAIGVKAGECFCRFGCSHSHQVLKSIFNPLRMESRIGMMAIGMNDGHGGGNSSSEYCGEEVVEGCTLLHGYLTTPSVKLHFVECGTPSGELVLLLHGFPNFWYVWVTQFGPLSQAGYRVIAPDLRGFNTSAKPQGVASYSRKAMESDVLHLIEHFGGDRPATLVGHDWGGALAWAFAERYPDKLRRLVIVNVPHAAVFRPAFWSDIRQMVRSWYIYFFQLPVIPEMMIRMFRYLYLRKVLEHGPCQPLSDDGMERHVQAYSKPGAVKAALNLYRAAFFGYWGGESCCIHLPTLLIWGQKDHYLRTQLAQPPKDLVPHAELVLLPQASHWPMWDEPDTFNDLLLQFLQHSQ